MIGMSQDRQTLTERTTHHKSASRSGNGGRGDGNYQALGDMTCLQEVIDSAHGTASRPAAVADHMKGAPKSLCLVHYAIRGLINVIMGRRERAAARMGRERICVCFCLLNPRSCR
jgi:hypothetical protein